MFSLSVCERRKLVFAAHKIAKKPHTPSQQISPSVFTADRKCIYFVSSDGTTRFLIHPNTWGRYIQPGLDWEKFVTVHLYSRQRSRGSRAFIRSCTYVCVCIPGGPKKRYPGFNFAITSVNVHRF